MRRIEGEERKKGTKSEFSAGNAVKVSLSIKFLFVWKTHPENLTNTNWARFIDPVVRKACYSGGFLFPLHRDGLPMNPAKMRERGSSFSLLIHIHHRRRCEEKRSLQEASPNYASSVLGARIPKKKTITSRPFLPQPSTLVSVLLFYRKRLADSRDSWVRER